MGGEQKSVVYEGSSEPSPQDPPAGMPPYPGPYGADPSTGEPYTEPQQAPDTHGNDENADGAKAGQTTADNHGDVFGIWDGIL